MSYLKRWVMLLFQNSLLKTTFDNMPEEQVMKLSRKTATRYREAATILHGKPTLLGIQQIF